MLRVGLTGGIGSGKSTVAAMFAELGVHVIEADAVGRRLMQPGQTVYLEILSHFGNDVLQSDGALDRKKLAAIAFGANRIDELNRIIHPAVIAEQEAEASQVFASDPNAIVMVESALIFEAERSGTVPGWRKRFDCLILVTVPDEVKVSRYVERISPGKWSEALAADARARIAAQIPDGEKLPFCDYIIENKLDIAETRSRVRAIYQELSEQSRATSQENPASVESGRRKDKSRL